MEIFWTLPSEPTWAAGDRSIRCFVAARGLKPVLSGTVEGIGTGPLPA
jgi:hypothetical protein